MKRKTLTLTLSLLVCLSLIGVGFASWIITSNNQESLSGNIVIDSVEDKRLNVTYEWVADANGTALTLPEGTTTPTLAYGIKSGVTNAPSWLSNDDTSENLSAYLKITITDKSGTAYTTANITPVLTASESFTSAATDGLVGELPTPTVDNKNDGTYIISFTLTWGTKFDGKNPAELFAGKAVDDDLPDALSSLNETQYTTCGDYASHYLDALDKAFTTDPTYTLAITVARE